MDYQNIISLEEVPTLEGFIQRQSSPDGFECPICFMSLADSPYAMIDNTAEKGRYHVECLELWLNKSRNGILTQDKVKSYTVYHQDIQIETVKLKPLTPPRRDRNEQYYQNNDNIRRNEENDDYCCLCIII